MRRRIASGVELPLCAIFLASVVARIYAAGLRTTPLYYPDEYIYAALSRSVASSGMPKIRGEFLRFPSLLAPYLMAPAWWISDVNLAYHTVLDLGAVWFSAAAFPAYALARKLGISARGGLAVAVLTVVLPDAAFATNAMTEPYAYPIFITTVLIALDAIVSPTRARQFLVVMLMAVLCLARVQFVFVPVVYALAVFLHTRGHGRRTIRVQPLFAAVALLGLLLVLGVGPSRLVGFYSFPTNSHLLLSIWAWMGMDLFVLMIAAGWVLVPGAVLGFSALVRSRDPRQKVFAVFALCSTLALVGQAAYVDALQHRIHERYTFYAVPLVVIASILALEARMFGRGYLVAAYLVAGIAILVPATQTLRSAGSDQSPTLLGLQWLAGSGTTAPLAWAVGLSLTAIAVGLFRARPLVPVLGAVAISATICVAGTHQLLRFVPEVERSAASRDLKSLRLGAPAGAALVTWVGTDRYTLMKTLFWTPTVSRVLVVGGARASDGFASTPVWFMASSGLVDRAGQPLVGPFAFGPDTTVISSTAGFRLGRPGVAWLQRSPRALILGLDRDDGYLSTVAELLVSPRAGESTVTLQVRGDGSRRTLTFACPSRKFAVRFAGTRARMVRIDVAPSGTTRCRISLTHGTATQPRSRITSGVRVLEFSIRNRGPAGGG